MIPEKTSSVKEFISIGKMEKMTFSNYEILQNVTDSSIQIGIHNIIDDYIDEVMSQTDILELSNGELNIYRFKPWLLSYDIYNTTNLDFLILKINNMISYRDFNKNIINILKPSGIELINKIYNAEKKYIRSNRNVL